MKEIGVLLLVACVLCRAAQMPLVSTYSDPSPLPYNGAGRFVHLTDMHPDKYYSPGSKILDACHEMSTKDDDTSGPETSNKGKKKKKKEKKKARAGFWGTPNSVCDSPPHLIEATVDWLARQWLAPDNSSLGIDFILWTGDTARHDIDFTHPRKAEEIFEYNRWALKLLQDRFPHTPIVPSLGNNDIIPHNIMFPGPNAMTRAFREIWTDQIPAAQHATFLDGGYFSTEVRAGDLAVISLNTLYWYDANAATRGCKKASQPGSIHLDWLEQQLQDFCTRGIQVHLIGHVPPTAGNYFSDCYSRYTETVLQYQDTIVGQHFGHMNIDAWFLQENEALFDERQASPMRGDMHASTLASDLRKDFDLVPTKQKTNLDAYLPFFVAPSVVPTYLPAVRAWTYNASRPESATETLAPHVDANYVEDTDVAADGVEDGYDVDDVYDVDDAYDVDNANDMDTNNTSIATSPSADTQGRSHRRPERGRKKHTPRPPPHVSPTSPSRSNRYLSLLGYSQWVLDLNKHNELHGEQSAAKTVEYRLEYTTYDAHTLWDDYLSTATVSHTHRPVPKKLLDRELALRRAKQPRSSGARKIKLDKRIKHLTDYGLPSVTITSLLELARALAADDKLWARFVRRIYTESD